MRSHLLAGTVRHRRVRPKVHELEHDVFYVALDLDELDHVARRFRLLSRNRRNVLSFHDADYLDPPASDVRAGLHAHLRAEGVDLTGWQVTLVTNLRILGYQFNPASFYLCRNAGGELEIVVIEVHNTHGERRLYTLRPRATRAAHVAEMDKDFYVSPFISMDAHYTVRVQDRPDDLRIVIDETEAGERVLQASVNVRRRPLTDTALLRMLVRYPLVTQKTIVMIHWHALRLWLKGIAFHHHGAAARPTTASRPTAAARRTAAARAAAPRPTAPEAGR